MPTLAVAIAVYGGFGALTYAYQHLPLWISAPVGAVWLTWFSSFQHETIHGHPTPWRALNMRIASLPLTLWIPYRQYRISHLQHHRHGGRYLTESAHDPESFYLQPGALARSGTLRRLLYRCNGRLLGRLTLGPALSVGQLWAVAARRIAAGDQRSRRLWGWHGAGVALVLIWTTWVCHIPFLVYALLMIYPSISLGHLRSFAEHRADPEPACRTVVVEAHPFWGLLFLNNNLHIAHHAYPRLPWYQLPDVWRRMRAVLTQEGQVYAGYGQLTSTYLFRAITCLEHPGTEGDRRR